MACVGLGQEKATAAELNSVRLADLERWEREDQEFAEDLVKAYSLATSRLVDNAYGRAMMGSERLTEKVLAWRDPARFADDKNRGHGGNAKSLDDMTVPELLNTIGRLKEMEAAAGKTIDGDFTTTPVDEAGQ